MATTANQPANNLAKTAGDANYNWRQLLSNAWIITRREVIDSFRDWRILTPIFILTFLFPFLATFVAGQFTDFVVRYGADFILIADRTIPFLLMIVGFFPISISLVIALETFVGEKERRSLEPLLSTPLTNTELYIGKTLSAMIPPLVASYGGMTVYLLTLLFGDLAWRPQPVLIIQIVLLTTVQALVMVTGAVVVSSQTTSTRAANLLASFIIIPMTLVVQGESFIMFIAPDAESPSGIFSLWIIILGMLVVVLLLLRVGSTIFNREELLGRSIDEINLRSAFRHMRRWTLAVDEDGTQATGLLDWYRRGITMSFRNVRVPIYIVTVWFGIAIVGGYIIGQLPAYQLNLPPDFDTLQDRSVFNAFFDTSVQTRAMGYIFLNNGRVLLAALLLAMFSFGSLALVVTPAAFVLVGYLFSQIVQAGYDLRIFAAAIVPHGIIEVPTVILATAVALRLGSIVTRPPVGKTVGEAWMQAFGDAIKLGIGLVIPGLLLGAFLEAFVTPRLVLVFLGA